MIGVDNLIYKSRLRHNKIATNEHQDIPEEDLLLIINEAQIKLVKEKNKQGNKDLEFLTEPTESHKLTPVIKNKQTNRWAVAFPEDYMFYVDSYLICDKDACKGRVVWVNPDLVGQGSIPTLLNNTNYKPSFEYQETFCDEQGNELGVYTDGTFTPKNLYLSYIRYPKNVDKEGYEDFEGVQSVNQDSEFPSYLEDELLDIITQDIAQYTENPSAYQASALSRQQK